MAPTTTTTTTTITSTRHLVPPTTVPTVGLDVAVALAEAVAESGFDAYHSSIDLLVADARRRGKSPVLVDIVADVTAPTAVRQRALGKLLLGWDRMSDPRPARSFLAHATIAA